MRPSKGPIFFNHLHLLFKNYQKSCMAFGAFGLIQRGLKTLYICVITLIMLVAVVHYKRLST